MSRITYVCTDAGIPVFGRKGGSVHVVEVIRAMRRAGHDVTLLAARTGGEPPPDLADLEVIALPRPHGRAAEREQAAQATDARIGDTLAALPRPDLVYERHALWSSSAMAWARREGVPAVLEVNAPLVEEQARHRVLHDRPAAEHHATMAVGTATRIVAVSAAVGRWATSAGAAEVAVIPNGVDPRRFADAQRPDRGRGRSCTIGFVGTLKPWHGLDVLVRAVDVLRDTEPDVRLLVVGDGPMREALQRQVAAARLTDRVELVGAVRPDDVPGHLRTMDVAVAPYPATAATYFSPLKVLEYMAAGVPVVASRVGQVPCLLDGGRTGVLVEPGCPAAIAAAVRRLRAEPGAADAMVERARTRVAERHTWDAVVRASLRGLTTSRHAAGVAAGAVPC